MITQCFHHIASTLHDAEDSSGKSCLLEQLRKAHRRERHAFARLQNKCISSDKRLRKHPQRHHHREVEWRDACNHTERFEGHLACDASTHFELTARCEIRQRASVLHALDALLHFCLCFAENLAVFVREQPREFFEIRNHQLSQAIHHMRAITNRPLAPRAHRCFASLRCTINIRAASESHLSDRLAESRIENILRTACGNWIAPLIIDPVACGGVGCEVIALCRKWRGCRCCRG